MLLPCAAVTMSYYDGLVAVLTILLALVLVICVVGAAWWLMWKVEQRNVNNLTTMVIVY